MLQTQTIKEGTYRLLKKLMHDEKLSHFYLVGGTALALYMGHRISIDLDLFSQRLFDIDETLEYLVKKYDFKLYKSSNATLIGSIDLIKVDCIRYDYPFAQPPKEYDGIRIYSMPDIAAMKLTAISQSGNRLKDFIDIAFLSTKMSLENMLEAFRIKYPNTSVMTAVRGITYFDDINFDTNKFDKRNF
ncbi:MAG: nucleotidyl transferase AbiEii/AbiGii toxin family protein [Marinilabiliaceae bacterium]|nr:nucleotidyl transferase AbiEii/AbiGii toxin family protein [Marinilabiliaceae bacterium]